MQPERKPTSPETPAEPPHAQLSWKSIQDTELTPTARLVLWALCYWAWGRRPDCWPSNAQIGALIGRSPRTVQLRLTELVNAGHVYRKMVRTRTGWHRIMTLAERWTPELAIVEPTRPMEPGGEGGATHCATPGAIPCATRAQPIAPPLAQRIAPQESLESEGERKEPARPAEAQGGAPASPGAQGEPEEPRWLRVDQAADLDYWRAIMAEPRHAMRRLAVKILARAERDRQTSTAPGDEQAPGTPGK